MPAFVDRDDQLTVLRAALAEAEQGRGGVVLMIGGLASGKTELLKNFGAYAASKGRPVLAAIGARAERRLPMGLVDQLFHTAVLPTDLAERARSLLRAEPPPVYGDDEAVLREARALGTLLLELAERDGPVVIGIDDVHFADDASTQVLLYLSRRLSQARILLVLNEPILPPTHHLPFRAQLTGLSHETLMLPPLSPGGVADILGDTTGRPTASPIACYAHLLTGGNPTLVRGLLVDNPDAGPDEYRVFGVAYQQAVLRCLHRCEPEVLEVARAVTILGEHTDVDLTATVAAVPPSLVAPSIQLLEDAGLLTRGRFRHEQGAAAVVEGMSEHERVPLRLRAAGALQQRGAAPAEVGGQLIAAGAVPGEWAIAVLRQVAQEALSDDNVDLAVTALELAVAECEDEPTRLALIQRLAQALWRENPAAAEDRMEPLRQALEERRLAPEQGPMLMRWILWQGLGEQYHDLLMETWPASDSWVLAADAMNAVAEAIELSLSYLWIYGPRENNPFSDFAQQISDRDGGTWLKSVISIGLVSFRDPALSVCDLANVPDMFVLGDSTVEAIVYAVTVLLHADKVEQADRWCTTLVAEAQKRAAPTWQALLSAVHGDVLLRRGDLERSAALAESALGLLSPLSWGVIITLPLTVLMTANTAMGRHEQTEQLLHRYRVPPAAGNTLLGLRYLRSRGYHRLATGNVFQALADFDRCGVQARASGIDLPELMPWRTDVAQARLRMGETALARQLAEEELELCRKLRSRGIATRVLAACADLRERPALLHTAVDLLQECDDQLELAHVTSQLARAYEELGDFSRARILAQSAERHARFYTPVAENVQVAPSAVGPAVWLDVPVLSDAELRVARLAARGHTNREIGRRLSITISTVEQHITRIYRKLNIKARVDLPDRLFAVSAAAQTAPDSPASRSGRTGRSAYADRSRTVSKCPLGTVDPYPKEPAVGPEPLA
jgi:DNA-binding CsgD family transcriptional regulator/tetratricopeptide (TPR) repeat protein